MDNTQEETPASMDSVGVALREVYFRPLVTLAGLLGAALFVASGHTASFFAWTPHSPVTAACMGGFYLAAAVLFWRASLHDSWIGVRLAATTPVVQISLIALATAAGHKELATNSGAPVPQAAAAIWQLFHYVVPFVLIGVLVVQLRKGTSAGPRYALLPIWARAAMALHGVGLLTVGGLLFLSPSRGIGWLGWSVGPLDVRIVAAWLITFGVTELLAGWEGDLQRVEGGMWALLVAGVAGLVIFVRYAAAITKAPDPKSNVVDVLTHTANLTHSTTLTYLFVVGSWLVMALVGFALTLFPSMGRSAT